MTDKVNYRANELTNMKKSIQNKYIRRKKRLLRKFKTVVKEYNQQHSMDVPSMTDRQTDGQTDRESEHVAGL